MKSRGVRILVAAAILFVVASPAVAILLELKDGGAHDIDYRIADQIWIDYQSPGVGTTVNVLEGADITSYYGMEAFGDSVVNMSGGWIERWLKASDSSQVAVSGGEIGGYLKGSDSSYVIVSGGKINDLVAEGSSQIEISGVTIDRDFYVEDDSQVRVSGGSMGKVKVSDSSQLTFCGGAMSTLSAAYNSQITISGGYMYRLMASYSSQVVVSGGTISGDMWLSNNSIVTIEGSNFAVDGTEVGFIELSSILGGPNDDDPDRRLTGTLLSGNSLNVDFLIGENARIVLVPEPGTVLLVGVGGMALLRGRREV